jgi:CheY-like chemotaxis protein
MAAAKKLAALQALVVDDQRVVRVIVEQLLREIGVGRVLHAWRADAAETMLGTGGVDAVVCDINMPPTNGLHLLRAVRSGEAAAPRDLVFVMLSGHSDPEVLARCSALDADGFVAKPLKPVELQKQFVSALVRQRALREPQAYARVPVDYRETPQGLVFREPLPAAGGGR